MQKGASVKLRQPDTGLHRAKRTRHGCLFVALRNRLVALPTDGGASVPVSRAGQKKSERDCLH